MIFWFVMVITFGFQTILNLTRPVISLNANELGASTFEIGLLTAAFAFLPLIFAIQAGKIADKIGDRLPILCGLIGMSVGLAVPFFYQNIWALFASQFIVGISNVFLVVSLQNILGQISTAENRDQYYSMFGMAVALGVLVGPVLGGYISEHYSYAFVYLVSILISVIPVFLSFLIPVIIKKDKLVKRSLLSSIGLLKNPILKQALISSALVLYSRDIFIAYFPLFAKENGITDSTIGWIISVQGIAMMIIRFILPKISNAFGQKKVLILSIVLAGFSFLFMPFTGHPILLGMLSFMMGVGLGCGQPISMSITYSVSPKSRTGEVLGLRLSTNRLSQLIAPILFGIIGSWMGILSVFLVSSMFLLGGSAYLSTSKKILEQNKYNSS
ncbi:MFS transporter [Niallia sp. Krafla_26]|uniref:MFS transporter n=1 Tax=Niallia sp. Krafla_26 TaxID=3064703 RepID=UPI003D16E15C